MADDGTSASACRKGVLLGVLRDCADKDRNCNPELALLLYFTAAGDADTGVAAAAL